MHYELKNYVDDDGKVITAKISCPVDGRVVTVYSGSFTIQVRTPQGVGQIPFEFEFPNELSLSQCFDKFEEMAKAKVEEFRQEQEDRNRIIPASHMPTPPPSGPALRLM